MADPATPPPMEPAPKPATGTASASEPSAKAASGSDPTGATDEQHVRTARIAPTESHHAMPRQRTVTTMLRHVVDRVAHAAPRNADGSMASRHAYPLYVARVLVQVVRQWVRDRCPQQASSLAYQTSLSLVPLVAIGLAFLRATGALDAQSELVNWLSSQIIPVSRDVIAHYLLAWAGNLSFQTAGFAGVVATLVVSFVLFSNVERIWNDIWRAEKRRSIGQRFIVFYALVTIVPMLMGLSLYQMARYGLTTGPAGALGALAATWGGLFFANKLLPTRRVSWRSAAVGALLSALAFEGAKIAFRIYVTRVAFTKYAGIYGALGLLPITLIWIYVSWVVILLGAELTYTVQNLRHLERLERQARQHGGTPSPHVNGPVAARLFLVIAAAWQKGKPAPTTAALADRFDVSEDVVARVLHRLLRKGFCRATDEDGEEGFIPARPLEAITVADLLGAFRRADLVGGRGEKGVRAPLDRLFAEIEAQGKQRARVTFAALLADDEEVVSSAAAPAEASRPTPPRATRDRG